MVFSRSGFSCDESTALVRKLKALLFLSFELGPQVAFVRPRPESPGLKRVATL